MIDNIIHATNFYSILIDITLIIIVIYNIIKGSQRGFVAGILKVSSYFLAYIFVWPISKTVSKYLYDQFFKDKIYDIISHKLMNNDINFGGLLSILSVVPGVQNSSNNFHLPNQLSEFTTNNSYQNFSDVISNISNTIVFPLFSLIVSFIIMIILFAIFSWIVKLICNFSTIISRVPIIGPFNRFLGGITGLVQAVIIIVLINLAINIFIIVTNDKYSFINSAVKNQTYILKNIDHFIKIDNISSAIGSIFKTVNHIIEK